MSDLRKALEHVFEIEGGWVNDPDDPGGETKYGVTHITLAEAVELEIVPKNTTVKSLTIELAEKIYQAMYWNKCKCDELPWPLNMYVFDAAVNQGVGAAIKMLQRVCNVAQDGIIGKVTVASAKNLSHEQQCLYMAFRAQRYFGTRGFDKFGNGWLKRLFMISSGA
jgi:lysozyme family protein